MIKQKMKLLIEIIYGGIYDENGTPYLDFYAGIAVNSAGNCNEKVVEAVINDHKEDLLQQRYEYPINHLLFSVREGRMKWADGKQVKTIFDKSILNLLGEKTEEDKQVGLNVS